MEYEELLDKAREELPKKVLAEAERFEIPKVKGHIQGNRTVISNFYQIADILHRPPDQLFKYLLKELATPGELTKSAAIIGRKISAERINAKVEQYVNEFVLCPECKKPDTQLFKEDRITFIRCMACGAKHPVKTVK
jgi:translation initiation factor 2 subunit 2